MLSYLMVRPACFGYNIETAASNSYQQLPEPSEMQKTQQRALKEFDGLVEALRAEDVDLLVIEDKEEPRKTCAVFPNNWFSTHENGKLVLYPMLSPNRRLERQSIAIRELEEKFQVNEVVDFSYFEAKEQFLEGTGSLVLDREHHIAYACLSPRTHVEPLQHWMLTMGYELVPFTAVDAAGQAIYHTNVMMWVGKHMAGIALKTIINKPEREILQQRLQMSGKLLIELTPDQIGRFCGNMLEVENKKGETLLVMSQAAYHALRPHQISLIESKAKIVYAPIPTIEAIGGGSARCMIAEVVLKPKKSTAV